MRSVKTDHFSTVAGQRKVKTKANPPRPVSASVWVVPQFGLVDDLGLTHYVVKTDA